MFSCPAKECKTIEVIAKSTQLNGSYEISEERSSKAPANPVWKNPEFARYFFYSDDQRWRIGSHEGLSKPEGTVQTSYYKGMHIHNILSTPLLL